MMLFQKKQIEEIQTLIDQKFAKKLEFNNYFGIDLSDCEVYSTLSSFLIRKKHGDFYRLYILSEDFIDLKKTLTELSSNHAINVPTKKDIIEFEKVMEVTGFELLAKYNRYVYNKVKKKKGIPITYANTNDFDSIKSILFNNFSPITGRLPDDKDLFKMIQEKQILVNRDSDKVSINGLIGYVLIKKKCYLSFWVDNKGGGLELLFSVFSILNENEIDYVYFWVNENNLNTIKIHKMLGAVPDGLNDYVFFKKEKNEK